VPTYGRKWYQTTGIALVMGMTDIYIFFLRAAIVDLEKKFCRYFSPNYWKCAKEVVKH
jgi:hypothetical protein